MPMLITPIEAAVKQLSRKQVVKKPPRSKMKVKPSDEIAGAEPRRSHSPPSLSRSEMFRRIKLLEKQLQCLPSTAQEAERSELVSKIAEYKSMRSVYATSPNRKVKQCKPEPTRTGPAMVRLSPKHHKGKVYISAEQRAIDKSKNGKRLMNLNAPPKSMLSVVGSSSKPFVNPVKKNARKAITTRKERMKLRSEFYRPVHGAKYPPYNRGTKELVLLRAA